jgi:hypothetical protein
MGMDFLLSVVSSGGGARSARDEAREEAGKIAARRANASGLELQAGLFAGQRLQRVNVELKIYHRLSLPSS